MQCRLRRLRSSRGRARNPRTRSSRSAYSKRQEESKVPRTGRGRLMNRFAILAVAAAVLVGALVVTPFGGAAAKVVRFALFARNAGAVDGIRASRTPRPRQLLALGRN